MGGIFLKIRTWWEVADRTQKVVTIFGSIFLVLLLGGTFFLAGRPKMAMAYGGLTPADQGRAVAEIQKLGIPVEFDLLGNVKVPSDKVAEVQAMLAKNGVSPSSGHLGNTDRGQIGIMSPHAVESAQLNAVREGEIAATLESLNGVVAAKVLLSGGERGAFASEDNPASASVTITEEPGSDLTGAPAKAMASLVAKAVPGLTSKNISIVNQDGISLFDGTEAEGSTAAFANKMQAQVNEARRIKRELQPLLDRFGAGNTVLTVRVDMDFDKRTERTVDLKTAAGAPPISKEMAEETMKGSGGSAAMIPSGTSGNVGAAPGFGDPGGTKESDYKSTQSNVQNPYSQVTTETDKAPGTVTHLTVSVLANSAKITDVAPIEQALVGYLGKDKVDQGTYSVTVTPATFDQAQEKAIATAASAAGSRERMQQIMSMLPLAALLIVAFLIIKSLGKALKSQNVLMHALPGGQMVPAGSLGGGDRSGYSEEEQLALDSNYGKRSKGSKGVEFEDEEDEDEPSVKIGKINAKVNVPLEQIRKMSQDRPDAVAMLLKSWLVEDRR